MIWYMQYIVSSAQTWIISLYINLNIYDFSGVRTFKIGCKIALVGKLQSGWEGRAQQSEVTSPRSCNKILKHLNRVYQDIESCWFPRCSNGGRSPTVSKYTGAPALQMPPKSPSLQVYKRLHDPKWTLVSRFTHVPQIHLVFQLWLSKSLQGFSFPSRLQAISRVSTLRSPRNKGESWKQISDFASFPHISNIWSWEKKLAWRSTRSRCG